jgi:hypothetical protein
MAREPSFQRPTRHYIPEDRTLQIKLYFNLRGFRQETESIFCLELNRSETVFREFEILGSPGGYYEHVCLPGCGAA